MHKTLRRYLDMESEFDRIGKKSGAMNGKEMILVPPQDLAADTGKVCQAYGIDLRQLVRKFAELRGETSSTTLYLENGILTIKRMVEGHELLLAAAHLIR